MDSISDESYIGEENMKIAFIVGGFSSISENFILNQITDLLDRGHDDEIFATNNPKNKKVHSIIKKYRLMKRVNYIDIPNNKIKSILKAIFLIIMHFPKDPFKI